jgi:D-threonine aldolase
MAEWYKIKNIDEIDSPALIVYPERVKENIRTITGMIEVDRLRPHIKTHKTKEVSLLLLEAGITKFKCATIAEAELLGTCGAPDVLLAYQPVGPKLNRFISLFSKFPSTRFSCLLDNINSAELFSSAGAKAGVTIPLFVDLNVGMNRTGIAIGRGAVDLYKQASALSGLEVVGFHIYDGHIRHIDLQKRKEESDVVFHEIEKMKEDLVAASLEEPIIIAGGTPTFPIHVARHNVECSPGTFVYWDAGYLSSYKEQTFIPAALVITRIISMPEPTKLCLDLGHKSVAAENDLNNRVVILNAPELKPISQSEEHLVVEAPSTHQYKIGDIFYVLPVHICPTCALYEKAIAVEEGIANNEWPIIARNRTITI